MTCVRRKRFTKPKLSVTLFAKDLYYENEPIIIQADLTNDNETKVSILEWLIPCEERGIPTDMSSFRIKTQMGQQTIPYIGPKIKRNAGGNYTIFNPGDSITCKINLGRYFDFSATSENVYEINYSSNSADIRSNTLVIKIA